ncbi:MAG: hypothetical protein KAW92_09380 [Candidatus Cloacimonetes bacterium]|nr:hypothetical protein [Candidatus Cloacimonadota bacterium]
MIYDIFHDECKEDGYWHCFIFIPRDKRDKLNSLLQKTRNNLNYKHPIHFRDIARNDKTYYTKVRLVQSWILILLYCIQQQKIEAYLYIGHKNYSPIYKRIKGEDEKIGAKLVIFRKKYNHKDMYEDMSITGKIETTFRMGLKGGTHFLFFDENIKIGNVFIDYEEEGFEKNFNSQNMLLRFIREAKENIIFEKDSKIIPIHKNNYIINDPISEFMQLADVTVGGFRTQKLQMKNFEARFQATKPLKILLEKEVEIHPRMKNSRYYKSFTFSDAWIENEEWKFENIHIEKDDNPQITLFDDN